MNTKVERTLLGVLPMLGLAIGLFAAAPGRPAMGDATLAELSAEVPADSLFRVEATTDQRVYHSTETARLTVRLLNEGSFSIYVGIGPDEPTFDPPIPNDPGSMPIPSIIIGYVTLTRLDQGPVICTAEMQPDGTVISNCPQPTRYNLSLLRSAQVPGHSTQIISTLEIPLREDPSIDPDERPGADPEDPNLCAPLPSGYYLLDCHVDGIYGTAAARAQQIIEIRS
ncbi:MAG: hypothetical protein JW741_10380 [Sedimentisphaerales bacterium]|nr:hypothetical protein [Sedimentisphaerales bacterium]